MTGHPLTTELLLETSNGDRANIKNLPAPVMQALYYQLTGKREKYIKIFNSDYLIEKESIRDLVVKLEQTLEQFSVQGSNFSATIIHFNKDKQDCSSIEKFSQYDSSRTDPVSSLLLRFDFLLTPPGVGESQNYTVNIIITSFVLLKRDRYGSLGMGKFRDSKPVIEVSIDYVDYVVSRSFQVTIEEWIESLSINNIFRIPEWISINRYPFLEAIKGASSCAVSYLIYITFFSPSFNAYPLFVTLSSFYLSKIFFDAILEVADDMMFAHAFFPFIIMNKGDERNLKKFKDKRKRYVKCGFAIFTGVIASLIAAIVSAPFLWYVSI